MKNYLALLGVVGAVILGFALHSLGTILVPFITGIIGAYILNHPVTALSKIKVPRGFGALLMILGVLFLLGTL
ncbi:MAG: AI-2E family transporter, partial [Proteobacteria bacterium]|nr:AI-2E family transporter [Pseudomonadota bacterium]